LLTCREMNEGSEAIARWLEHKRRAERAWAAVICVVALSCGTVVFLLTTFVIYTVVRIVSVTYAHSEIFSEVVALGLTAWSYARIMKRRRHQLDLELDPMGLWIFKDLYSIGPRMLLEGLLQVRHCAQLGELNVAACVRVLTYLAEKNAAVSRDDLLSHCAQMPWERLREQLLLLDGVLFLGEDGSRVTLMEPFRLLLRSMLPPQPSASKRPEPARPRPQPAPDAMPLNEPEKLSAYELLGLSPSASWVEIKAAYRKRVKACHPDLFAGTDEQARALAERWTKALNAAYATLNPRQRGTRPASSRER
jgi:hypothetical protein